MGFWKKNLPVDPDTHGVMREAEAAISESSRVSRRINRIIDEYQNTEKVLVDQRRALRGIKHA